MRNPYKKFQNSSIHSSKVMLCIKKRDERMDGQTDGRMDEQPRSNMPLQLEVEGIKRRNCSLGAISPLFCNILFVVRFPS